MLKSDNNISTDSSATRESGEGEEGLTDVTESTVTAGGNEISPSPTSTATDDDFDENLESMSGLFRKNWKKEIVDTMYTRCVTKLNEDPNKISLSGIAITTDDMEELIDIPTITTSPRSSSSLSSRFNCLPRISLKDVRSLTLTRRSFLRFIYEEMSSLLATGITSGILIERKSDGNGFRKKCGVKIVLYLNHSIADLIEQEESERNKNRMRPTSYVNTLADKLCIWSIIGVQGAILSHVLEPIYIDTILVSSRTRASKLSSILNAKMNQLINLPIDSPRGFMISIPTIEGTGIPRTTTSLAANRLNRSQQYLIGSSSSSSSSPAYAYQAGTSIAYNNLPYYYHHRPPSPSSSSPNPYTSAYDRLICLNYISILNSIEAIYSDTGATIAGKSSRICKASLFDLFASLSFARTLPKLSWSPFTPAYPLSYMRVKSQAIPYQVMKAQVLDRMKKDTKLKISSSSSLPFRTSNSDNFYAFDPK